MEHNLHLNLATYKALSDICNSFVGLFLMPTYKEMKCSLSKPISEKIAYLKAILIKHSTYYKEVFLK